MTMTPTTDPRYGLVQHRIGGVPIDDDGPRADVHNPSTGEIIAHVPLGSTDTVGRAVQVAREAFSSWSALTSRERAEVFYRYRTLLEEHVEELGSLIREEHGKTKEEAEAEVYKAIEETEFACSLPQLTTGSIDRVSAGVECRSEILPLGVVASITPFNFPCMVPHWTIPTALVLGNTMVLKPSERVPLTAARTADLLAEAGLPPGVFNVVNGDRSAVEALCDHPDVVAVTFVGSTPAAQSVFRRATSTLKRALALGGAKNHVILLPDADPVTAPPAILGAMAGCTGQRCMAASVLVTLPGTDELIDELIRQARAMEPGVHMGPVISAHARDRIVAAIDEAEREGARVVVDGRSPKMGDRSGGFWLGPTVIDGVTPAMRISRDEVFGPVLAVMRVDRLLDAVALENASPFGNAASVFTNDGGAARTVTERVRAGMVGVNVGVPVPREPFSFGGWYHSRFGVGDITGSGSLAFWTQSRKVTTRWAGHSDDAAWT